MEELQLRRALTSGLFRLLRFRVKGGGSCIRRLYTPVGPKPVLSVRHGTAGQASKVPSSRVFFLLVSMMWARLRAQPFPAWSFLHFSSRLTVLSS